MGEAVAVILAAGLGTRMKSALVKVLHPLCGHTIIDHVVAAVQQAGVNRIIVVVGHQANLVQDRVRACFTNVEFALQAEQLGTGHAVMQAMPALRHHEGPVLVTHGDTPLFRPETYAQLLAAHRTTGASAVLLSAVIDNPHGYGRVIRDEAGRFVRIVEQKDATATETQVKEINTGTYCFSGPELFRALGDVRPNNRQGEYYLTDVVAILRSQGRPVEISVLEDHTEALGINDRVQLAQAERILRNRILNKLMLDGVTVLDPATTLVDPQVRIGLDTILYPFTLIEGNTTIGANCRIGPNVHLVDSHVEDGAVIEAAVARGAQVGRGKIVGPFAHLPEGGAVPETRKVD